MPRLASPPPQVRVRRRRGSGLASEQSEALLQEAAKHAAEFGRSEVDTEHLLLALADSDVVKTIWVSSRSRSMTSSGRSSLRPSAGTSPSRADRRVAAREGCAQPRRGLNELGHSYVGPEHF